MRVRKRSSINKKAYGDRLWYATILAKVGVDELDLASDDRIVELKKQDIPLADKIKKAKEISASMAYSRLSEEFIEGTRLTDNSIQDIQLHTDRLDWDTLFEEE